LDYLVLHSLKPIYSTNKLIPLLYTWIFSILKNTMVTALIRQLFSFLVAVGTAKYYKAVMEKIGSRCDLMLYEGEGHGFFNYEKPDNYKKQSLRPIIFYIHWDT